MNKPVTIDDESTWPRNLRQALEMSLPNLRLYEETRRDFDKRAETDLHFRFNSTPNPYQPAKDAVVAAGNVAMAGRKIIGFHCTRLHDDDVSDICANGLRVLNHTHLHSRIDARVAAGEIPTDIGAHLRVNNLANQTNRAGMLWLIFTKPLLSDEFGVIRLLRSWGGEALYGNHESDPQIGPLLRTIGRPSIVEMTVCADDVHHCDDIGEILRRGYLLRRGITVENSGEMAGHVRGGVKAKDVIAVHQQGHPRFDELTQCARWTRALS